MRTLGNARVKGAVGNARGSQRSRASDALRLKQKLEAKHEGTDVPYLHSIWILVRSGGCVMTSCVQISGPSRVQGRLRSALFITFQVQDRTVGAC